MALFLQSDVLSFEAGATKHNKMATLIKLIINNTAYSQYLLSPDSSRCLSKTWDIYQLNMTIFQALKQAINLAKYRLALLFRGESYSSAEATLIFNIKHSPKQTLSLKKHEYPELQQFFIWFLNSAAVGGRVTGDNLTFVIGGDRAGKSQFLAQSIECFLKLKHEKKGTKWQPQLHRYIAPQYCQFLSRCQSFDNEHSIILSFNFAQTSLLNFQGVVETMHENMISAMVKLNSSMGQKLLDPIVVKDVLIAQHAEEYLFVFLKDTIYCICNQTDPLLMQQPFLQRLQQLTLKIKAMEAHQFFSSERYNQLIDILSQGLKLSPAESAIRLFVSVGRRMEYQHRAACYQKSWFTSGIQSTNILFDLLNFLCGFGAYNNQTVARHFAGADQPSNEQQNWIKSGNRIDVALCLLNLDSLAIWQTQPLNDFIDHIVCRTAGANGIRTHFPVVIELPSAADVEDVLAMGQFQIGTVPFIQIPGYLNYALPKSGLSKVFAPKILNRLFYSLGKSPQSWNQALMQLGSGTSIEDIINGKAEFIKTEGIRAQAKFNRIFTTLQAQQPLSNGTIREELIQHLRFIQKGKGMLVLDRPGYYVEFVTRPLFQAMQRQGLIYHNFYLPHLDLSHLVTLPTLIQIKNKMLKRNKARFLMWRFRNRHRYSMLGFEINFKEKFDAQSRFYDKYVTFRTQNQLSETYYGPGFAYLMRYSKQGVYKGIAE